MKRHEIVFSALKVPIDYLLIFSSFFLAREFRLLTDYTPGISWFRLPVQTISNEHLLPFAAVWWLLFVLLMTVHWLYNIKLTASKIKEWLDIIFYGFYWFVFFSVLVYLWKDFVYKNTELPRLIILYTFIFWVILVIIGRILLNWIQSIFITLKIFAKRNLILISNHENEEIKNILADIKNLEFTIFFDI